MKRPFSTGSNRIEAFSDGVIAVLITIMVLDLRAPIGTDLGSLHSILPTLVAYVLSFVFLGIYWNNHHHMLRATRGIDGLAMWANLHLLFWLSLVPFTTSWLGRNPTAAVPTALYGFVLFMDAIAYTVLQTALLRLNGADSPFARAVETDWKVKISPILYVLAIGLAFWVPAVSDGVFVLVAALWFVPDRRFEPVIANRE
ncbi:MAG TPA: TMEM175 family protein [Candidatus Tumulicola sp.]